MLSFSSSPCCCPPFRAGFQLGPSCQDSKVPWEMPVEDRNASGKDCSCQRTVCEGRSVKIVGIKIVCKAPVVLICQPDHFQEESRRVVDSATLKVNFGSWRIVPPGSRRDSAKLHPEYPGRATEEKAEGEGQTTHCTFMPAATKGVENLWRPKNHAWAYHTKESPVSKSPDLESQSPVPSPLTLWLQRWLTQPKGCLSG